VLGVESPGDLRDRYANAEKEHRTDSLVELGWRAAGVKEIIALEKLGSLP
jgi:hypothetical protein